MSREKQIEEMARFIVENTDLSVFDIAENIAQELYTAGYRKQSENTIELPCKVGTTLYFLYNSPYADKPDLTPRILQDRRLVF